MSVRFFISDLHLGPDRPELSALFFDFLSTLPAQTEALWILGDLFESWIGDDDDEPTLLAVGDALRNLAALGVQLHCLHGNRDFLLGKAWCDRFGVRLHAAPVVLDVAEQRCLLMHGDELCLGDQAYQRFRAMVRNPAWQQQILALPLPVRRAKAEELRAASREQTRMKAADIMDVDPAEVARVMAEHGVRRLLHGHTHRPAVHHYAFGQRIVLGDWGPLASYLREDETGLCLAYLGQHEAVPAV